MYFHAGGGLAFDPPTEANQAFDEYVSDPAKPAPFSNDKSTGFPHACPVEDQRFAASRPDVLVYETEPLEEDLTFAGALVGFIEPGAMRYGAITETKLPAMLSRRNAPASWPHGIYLTYFEAMFRNGAREFLPKDWPATEAHFKLCELYGVPPRPMKWKLQLKPATGDPFWYEWNGTGEPGLKIGDHHQGCEVLAIQRVPLHDYTKGLGEQHGRFHGLASPCLSTRILADHPWREEKLKPETRKQKLDDGNPHSAGPGG